MVRRTGSIKWEMADAFTFIFLKIGQMEEKIDLFCSISGL
jgi:hypothetical protein